MEPSTTRFRGLLLRLAIGATAVTVLVAPVTLLVVRLFLGVSLAAIWGELLGVTVAAAALGMTIGVAIYTVPMRILSAQAAVVEAANAEVTALNRMLSQKVNEAVAEARVLSTKIIDMQEHERRRIARDLHDGVGQAVTALQLELDNLKAHPERGPQRLGEALRICHDVMAGLRQAIYDLRPPEIGQTPLSEILQSYAERFEIRTRIPTSFKWRGGPVASEPIATCLLRILQEAFTNVAKYARASEVGVRVLVSETQVEMTVEDDGVGFTRETLGKGSGLGGMRERCAFFGGTCEVQSTPGRGTMLTVTLPLLPGFTPQAWQDNWNT